MKKTVKTIPGNPDLASSDDELNALASLDEGDYRYTVEDYFGKPKASTFRFSPDGKYMSYREKDENGKRHIYVKEISTGQTKKGDRRKGRACTRIRLGKTMRDWCMPWTKAEMKTIMFML